MSIQGKTKLPIVFGAMTIGKPGVEQTRVHDFKDAAAMLDIFQKYGHNEVDTARVYGGGSLEEYLGKLNWQERGLVMETKLYPGGLYSSKITHNAEDLRKHLLESLIALNAKKVDMWYLHGPDRKTPYEETFRVVDELHKEGYFDRFGISNYMSWEVAQINDMCIQNGWIRPSVYQGVYCSIHRSVEAELFPCLKHYGMGFYAFNPLAGGYLTNRYHRGDDSAVKDGSRFDLKTSQGQSYRKRFWNDAMFDALDITRAAAENHDLTEAECALRWMMHHSKLEAKNGDAVIIGASSTKHLEENLRDFEKGPLLEDVVVAFDDAWVMTKGHVSNYFH